MQSNKSNQLGFMNSDFHMPNMDEFSDDDMDIDKSIR